MVGPRSRYGEGVLFRCWLRFWLLVVDWGFWKKEYTLLILCMKCQALGLTFNLIALRCGFLVASRLGARRSILA